MRGMDMTRRKILIVDDKTVNRYILSGIFEDEYEITECAGGNEAIAALAEHGEEVSAILLDMLMPSGDGFAVLQYMKENNLTNVPVVMISANENDDNIRKAYSYEVADYIQKPFQESVVKSRVEKVIDFYEKRRKQA